MTQSILRAIALSFGLIMAAAPAAQAQQVVDPTFEGVGLEWDRNGGMIIRYKAYVSNGELVICGAFSNWGGRTQTRLGRQVIREAVARLNGSRVRRGLSFFNIVSNANNDTGLVGQETGCAATGTPATAADLATFEVEIRSGRYRARR